MEVCGDGGSLNGNQMQSDAESFTMDTLPFTRNRPVCSIFAATVVFEEVQPARSSLVLLTLSVMLLSSLHVTKLFISHYIHYESRQTWSLCITRLLHRGMQPQGRHFFFCFPNAKNASG